MGLVEPLLGGTVALKAVTETIESHCQEIPLDTYPPTFRNSILIIRSLGLRYLYIGEFCSI
jgi:hypothetical protein